jgi:hypothetical protein
VLFRSEVIPIISFAISICFDIFSLDSFGLKSLKSLFSFKPQEPAGVKQERGIETPGGANNLIPLAFYFILPARMNDDGF